VSRWALLTSVVLVWGCSDLTEGGGGVVGLEIRTPEVLTLAVGQTVQLTARALDKNGNEVIAPIEWRAPDPTLAVDQATGVITGVSPGPGRVQAFTGTLSSAMLEFTVAAGADTLIVTDSILTVAPGVAVSPPLVSQVQSLSPVGPVANHPVVYTLISPLDATVTLPGGGLTATANTGTDGAVSTVTLTRVNLAQPVTAIVAVSALRAGGTPVPGSGQRFTVTFQ
jgi:Bacterial Ig-like domain (group 2)